MGVEVAESKINVMAETENEANVPPEGGKVNIKFGSHAAEEPAKGHLNKLSDSGIPKDAVDEWPEPAQVHSFYIVRYRAFEDRELKAKLDAAEKDLQKKNQARSQIVEKLRGKRAARSEIRSQIHSLSVESKQYREVMDGKIKEMEPLQQALGKLRGAGPRERGSGLCSSEEELNDLIKSLHYRIQHESIPLSEEKQILREIKQLEGTREKVIAIAAERARIQDSLGEKQAIQDQVKLMGVDLDGVRKEKQVVSSKIKQLDEGKVAVEKDIKVLEKELETVTQKRDQILASVVEMRKQRDESNSPFYQNRTVLSKAKVVAAQKDAEAVKELTRSEVEKFMSVWNSNKAFRDDYESRILQSLDMRLLSKDGRIRNPGEKPLMVPETPLPSETDTVVKKSVKQAPKENSISPLQDSAPPEQTVAKGKSAKNNKGGNKKTEIPLIEQEYKQEASPVDKLQKDSLSKSDKVDEKKLKELKREEEIAKRNQAEERKKKLAEKAAAKAAIKAQKEAEKKLKEREKRARKKAGAAVAPPDSEEPSETVPEVSEPEKVEENTETPATQKNNDRKEHLMRHRARPRAPNALPKAILKRKKASKDWLWVTVPAALLVLVLLVVGYNYLS
ncbi:proton pump-interactor 1 isoform X2 [Sesamum indicum]|uniref:Proton pump-interactor 1 isoform X2 n=1 Tax=Sesamum indicum TaxID=4182 RepID=A0A6I9UTU9_SESIN|nr:proton pump-interactor 1 isoform X1 [Sesamum indicum]XP_011098300.1 proton pump-interactor 1 isoform X2 [Sesamum indicum]